MLKFFGSGRDVLAEVEALHRELAAVRGDLAGGRQAVQLHGEVIRLQQELSALQIRESNIKEQHAREERELTHMIGLQKKAQDQELVNARREAVQAVREENLAAERKRFDHHMSFREKRFTEEVGYLKDLMGQILERLPTVTVDRKETKR